MIVKVLDVKTKQKNYVLPAHILKHCKQYQEKRVQQASLFAWSQLGKYINLKQVKFTKNNKPYLTNNTKYFSLSHSFNKIAFVIDNKPIGIDIEAILPFDITRMLAQRLLDQKQLKEYHNAKDNQLWFTKYWTKYEAYTKLLGDKLTFNSFKEKIKAKITTKTIKSKDRTYILSIAQTK